MQISRALTQLIKIEKKKTWSNTRNAAIINYSVSVEGISKPRRIKFVRKYIMVFDSVHSDMMSTRSVGSSLYYDEDGDLAHEFYEETVVTKNGRKKSKLKRIQKNLIPQVS